MGWKCLSRCMHQDIMLWIEERASLLSPCLPPFRGPGRAWLDSQPRAAIILAPFISGSAYS